VGTTYCVNLRCPDRFDRLFHFGEMEEVKPNQNTPVALASWTKGNATIGSSPQCGRDRPQYFDTFTVSRLRVNETFSIHFDSVRGFVSSFACVSAIR